VLLLRNKDQEYNNPLAGFATRLCMQRSELRTCAKRVGDLAVTTLPQAHNQEGRSPLLQPLRWRCVECAIHHEWDVCEE